MVDSIQMILYNFFWCWSIFFFFFYLLIFFYVKVVNKKMYSSIRPTSVFIYFDNIVCYRKATRLSSCSLARCVHFICTQTQRHNSEYICYCFKCRLAGLLVNILHSSRHLGLLSLIVKDNCLMSDRYVSDFFKEIKRKAIDF